MDAGRVKRQFSTETRTTGVHNSPFKNWTKVSVGIGTVRLVDRRKIISDFYIFYDRIFFYFVCHIRFFTQVLRLQHKLIDLLNAEHMSLPLKLQIIRTLDSTLFFPIGYKTLTETNEIEQSPYQRLAESFLGKNVTEIYFSHAFLTQQFVFFFFRVVVYSSP